MRRAGGTGIVLCGGAAPETASVVLATGDGAAMAREGNVGDLNQPAPASFLTPALGWVAGTYVDNRDPGHPRRYWRVVSTSDGGRTWRVDYAARGG